jgi:hypothetical protein
LHGRSVATRQDKTCTDATIGADGTKYPYRFCALILARRGPGSPWSPAPCQFGLLVNPRFILPPDFYGRVGRERGPDYRHFEGEIILKPSRANSFCPLCFGRTVIRENSSDLSSRLTFVSSRDIRNSSQIHCLKSLRRQRTTSWIAGIGPLSTIADNAWR